MLKEFRLSKLVPQVPEPRYGALNFLMEYWTEHGSLDGLPFKPLVNVIDGVFYLSDGNQRAIFYHLNGFETMMAEELTSGDYETGSESLVRYNKLSIAEELGKRGIISVGGLAEMVENPERYMITER